MMPAELVHPDDWPDPAERLSADLAGYLRDRSGGELADLLDRLPDPVKVDLITELTARGPAWLRLPPAWLGHPDQEHDRRASAWTVDWSGLRVARAAGQPPERSARQASESCPAALLWDLQPRSDPPCPHPWTLTRHT